MNSDLMTGWTASEVAAVTGGSGTENWYATGVAISLSDLKPGNLYFATKDDDLEKVFKKGAVAVVMAGGAVEASPGPVLKVPDTFEALRNLAGAARFRTHATIISVQGKDAREEISRFLSCTSSVHEGGRHLSLGLANLPESVEYGVFGSSPAVRPDIAVITNCEAASRDTLFETMPASGTVIVNADEEEHLSIIARAKAAGVQNIFTYGRHASADARLYECLYARNGVRLTAGILGEDISFVLPGAHKSESVLVAALLLLKLTGKSLNASLKALTKQSVFHKTPADITLIDPVLQQNKPGAQAVFRITNMIDWGLGRQTAVLDNFTGFMRHMMNRPIKGLSIPAKIASLDFVHTSKNLYAVTDAHAAIREKHENVRIEPIVPDVATPGDFLVFKEIQDSAKAVFSEALRLVPEGKVKKTNAV